MASVYLGHPFPRKGFVYTEAVMAMEEVKRVTLSLFLPFVDIKKGLIGFLESYLSNYNRLIDRLLQRCERVPYLHYEYYCEFSKATWDFTCLFLRRFGFSFTTSYKTGLILATIFENDDAYRFPLEDILSETTKEKLQDNPRQEIDRLLEIFKQRSTYFSQDEQAMGNRIEKIAKLLKFLLLIPSVKKSFKFALENINFNWFQYDELDRYWALQRKDYMSFGEPFETRMEKMVNMMIDFAKKQNPDKEIVRTDLGDGRVKVSAI